MFRSPHARPMIALLSAFAVAIGTAVFMSVGTAHAEIDGPCVATIAGVDVASVDSGNRDDDIPVSEDQSVEVGAAAAVGFESHKIQLEFGGQRWTVSDEEDNGSTSWSGTVDVDDYATYGVGLYKVIGVSTLEDGTTCEGAATVDVGGNPLTTVAGAAAAATTVAGVAGATASAVVAATRNPGPLSGFGVLGDMTREAWQAEQAQSQPAQTAPAEGGRQETAQEALERFAWNPVLDWIGCLCLAAIALVMTPLMAVTGGGPGNSGGGNQPPATPPESSGAKLPRAPWLPRVTLLGLVGGFLAGAGSVVLMQQYSIEYPTLAVVLRTVIVTTLVGGVVLPTIGYTISWMRINRKISRLEQELK